jgi:hypothetical protein
MYYKKSRREKYSSLDKDLFIQKPIANEDLVAVVYVNFINIFFCM